MGNISELFWRLFQSSGHVGAYLLYTSYRGVQEEAVSSPQRADKQSSQSAHVRVGNGSVRDRVTREG